MRHQEVENFEEYASMLQVIQFKISYHLQQQLNRII